MPEKRAVTQGIHAGPGSTVANVTQVVNVRPRDYYAPFQAPPLPPYFVPRPEVSVRLKARLLAENEHPSGALVISAIHGLGGIGKSTLAAAMARDPDVLARFPDGILWATLGQQPDVLSILTGWIQALGDYDFRPTTAEVATAHLRTLLHNKAALLVVDDAWESGHVRPFLTGGDRCRVLITTREAIIAGAVGAGLYNLDVMTLRQSLTLLEHRLRHRLEGKEKASAQELARIVGYLPLALKLAAAQVADGVPWGELIADLTAEIARLESLEPPGAEEVHDEQERKYLSLNASFNLSLRRLPQGPRESFAWLGILPEDVRLTPKMMATVWAVRTRKARDTLRYLWSKALLMPGTSLPDGTLAYRLHDLLHNLARRLLTAPPKPARKGDLPGLGLTLQEANARLLEQYRAQTRDGLWHTLPDDDYIYAYLTWHLEQAGHVAEIHALLREETPEGRNGWYEARERIGQTAGYLADVARAWRLAATLTPSLAADVATLSSLPSSEVGNRTKEKGVTIGLQCRYALITVSMNSLARNLPPVLMAALVKEDIWTPTQGLAYAQQVPDPKQRAEAMAALLPYLPDELQQRALRMGLSAVQNIQSNDDYACAMANLAPYLPPHEALNAINNIQNECVRAESLAALVPNLPSHLLSQALNIVRNIKAEQCRAKSLKAFVPYLPPDLALQALDIVKGIHDIDYLASVFVNLAPNLPRRERAQIIDQVLDAARKKPEVGPDRNSPRAHALAVIAQCLPPDQQRQIMREALDVALLVDFPDNNIRVKALVDVAPYLPSDYQIFALREAWKAAQHIEEMKASVEAMASLVPFIPPSKREVTIYRILDAIQIKNSKNVRAKLLISFATYTHLPVDLAHELLADVIPHIQDAVSRAKTLTTITSNLPKELQQQAWRMALKTARNIQKDSTRSSVLITIAPHLPKDLRRQALKNALDAVRNIQDNNDRAHALAGLILSSGPDALKDPQVVLRIARNIEPGTTRDNVLATIISYLAKLGHPREAWDATLEIENSSIRNKVLTAVVPHLPQELLQEVWDTVWKYIKNTPYVLAAISPHLPSDLQEQSLQRALDITWDIWDDESRAYTLLSIVPYVPEKSRQLVAQKTLESIRFISSPHKRADALISFVPNIPSRLLPQAINTALYIRDANARFKALYALVSHMSENEREPVLQKALDAAKEIQNTSDHVKAISTLVPYLPRRKRKTEIQKTLVIARKIQDANGYVQAISALAPYLPEEERKKELQKALTIAGKIQDTDEHIKAILSLAPYLPKEKRVTLLREALAIAMKVQYADSAILYSLVLRLSPELLSEALTSAWNIREGALRFKALSVLAPSLAEWSHKDYQSAYSAWKDTLLTITGLTRPDLLINLHALAPFIAALGEEQAIAETFHAIQDVGRWWP